MVWRVRHRVQAQKNRDNIEQANKEKEKIKVQVSNCVWREGPGHAHHATRDGGSLVCMHSHSQMEMVKSDFTKKKAILEDEVREVNVWDGGGGVCLGLGGGGWESIAWWVCVTDKRALGCVFRDRHACVYPGHQPHAHTLVAKRGGGPRSGRGCRHDGRPWPVNTFTPGVHSFATSTSCKAWEQSPPLAQPHFSRWPQTHRKMKHKQDAKAAKANKKKVRDMCV